MTLTTAELLRQQALDLDYDDVKELLLSAGLKGDIETLSLDWTQKQININTLADSSTSIETQVALNVIAISNNATNISTNTGNITTNTSNIGTNTTNIGTNTTNITTNATNLTNHIADTSTHGVTGNIVGTTDFALTLTGGVVLLANNVADAVQSTVTVTSPDATAAPAVYDQTDAQTAVTLVNELKADLTQAITDFNLVTAQLNAFLAANQTANQMA